MVGSSIITRELIEAEEHRRLSAGAAFADETKGRVRPLPLDEYRTEFQRDRDRIIHCKAFRRLSHKTQVFLAPEGDHYRTRLTHTLEVSQISRSIARALGLNEDLTEAISLGHDLGHTPFGHTGESALDDALRRAARGRSERPRGLPAQRAVAAHRRPPRVRGQGAQPHPRGARRHPRPHRFAHARDARGPDRAHRRPHRVREPRHRRRRPRGRAASRPSCRAGRSRCSARITAPGSPRWSTT